jgi:hypothetical protein
MHLALDLRRDGLHFEQVDRHVDGAFLQARPYCQRQNRTLVGQDFKLPPQVSDIFEAKLFRSDRPRLPNSCNKQIRIRDTIAGVKKGSSLIDETVNEPLPFDVLPRLLERASLLGRLWKLDDFIVTVTRVGSHGVKPIHYGRATVAAVLGRFHEALGHQLVVLRANYAMHWGENQL